MITKREREQPQLFDAAVDNETITNGNGRENENIKSACHEYECRRVSKRALEKV